MIEFKKISRVAPILVLAGLALIAVVPVWAQTTGGWVDAPPNPPNCDDPNIPGCNPPINTSSATQVKSGTLFVDNFIIAQLGKITQSNYVLPQNLHFGVDGNIGAAKYCDLTGTVCKSVTELGGGGGLSEIQVNTAPFNSPAQYQSIFPAAHGGKLVLEPTTGATYGVNAGSNVLRIYGGGSPTQQLPLNPGCRSLTQAEMLASKVVWDEGQGNFSCVTDLTGGDPAIVSDTIWQKRVTAECTGESSIKKINQDGTVVCESDSTGAPGSGDNLGNHIATQDLDMKSNNVLLGSNSRISPIAPNNQSGLTVMTSGKLGLYVENSFGTNGQALVSNGTTANWGAVKNNGLNLTTTKYSASASGVSSDTETMGNYNFCGLSRVDRASGAVVGEPYGECKIDRTGGNTGSWVLVATSRDSASGITCEAYCF